MDKGFSLVLYKSALEQVFEQLFTFTGAEMQKMSAEIKPKTLDFMRTAQPPILLILLKD